MHKAKTDSHSLADIARMNNSIASSMWTSVKLLRYFLLYLYWERGEGRANILVGGNHTHLTQRTSLQMS